ncbi:MAG: lysophospholipid acyltransferase family protein [Sulfurimonas sp.]|uniref:lysophospholipid acyltransferase family protein n=1 Tax=Sulfurimonas sp. TaxID=2022749 RepID=UPI00260C03F4|nr:lysophospholipid acyltransferase family protein [Sulfurimonas sp.]MDD3476268.1 lysophospholipid acyltransferase family protein [Sulfurimonas sp.]HUH43449.1 lysophospholipid acyltransferase family protein [Sulfurimonas sp.]
MVKKLLRALALLVVPFIASLFIRFLYATNKKNFHSPESISDEPIIFACWHGELLMLPYLYSKYRKTPHAKVLISSHFDGLLISKTIKYFGLGTIAGSTNRNAARVLIQAITAIKDGYDIGITPDGPKGPRHEVADGIIAMAQKTKAKIVLVEIKPTKFWQLNSWDKFTIPKPFGTLNYYSTQPIDVSNLDIISAKKLIEEGLLKHEK